MTQIFVYHLFCTGKIKFFLWSQKEKLSFTHNYFSSCICQKVEVWQGNLLEWIWNLFQFHSLFKFITILIRKKEWVESISVSINFINYLFFVFKQYFFKQIARQAIEWTQPAVFLNFWLVFSLSNSLISVLQRWTRQKFIE